MNQRLSQPIWNSTRTTLVPSQGRAFAQQLLSVVDIGLIATIGVAPFVFGGRHDLGRLVFVALVAMTSAAWFVRQSLLHRATWNRTFAFGVLLAAAATIVMQIVPLRADWLARLTPRTIELLPLWKAGSGTGPFGCWQTLSLTPYETTLALAMLISYGLLFVVVSQRLQSTADIERLLNVVAGAAVLMAAFGLLQLLTSNGQFFWCYLHPYRATDQLAMGSFMNRNHFASFLVLGLGPLVRWLFSVLREPGAHAGRRHLPHHHAALVVPGLLLSAIVIVLLAIALSLSRGGALALLASTVIVSAFYWHWRLVDGKYLYALAGVGLLMLGLLSIYGYEQVTNRLDDFTTASIDKLDESGARRKVWRANLLAFQHGWLVGSGVGSHGELCPIYLDEPSPGEYTHAENGYLQIATEAGVVGIALLVTSIALCGAWCVACLARLKGRAEQLCFGAAAAGLGASLVHSLVDFVWYIPACLSVTLVLAVVTLRLAQLALPSEKQVTTAFTLAPQRWIECTALVALLGGWAVYSLVGPAVAAIHWDRYLRDAVAGSRLLDEQSLPLAWQPTVAETAMRDPLILSMQHHLEETVRWNPSFGRAQLRLATRYVQRFELAQQDAENAMTLSQIRDASLSSRFASPGELRAWLERAFGANVGLLYQAHAHARRAVELSPLQGEGYVLLAQLGFLVGEGAEQAEAYVAQACVVRPFDGDVLFEAGKQALLKGDVETALREWGRCFPHRGAHQLRIVSLLAGRIPAAVLVEQLHPDWHTLREFWARYREFGTAEDLEHLVAYAADVTQGATQHNGGIPPAYAWLWLGSMQLDLKQQDLALACLERANQLDQHVFRVRYLLGFLLKDTGKYAEAEPHLRWCLARRPESKELSAALIEITKLRLSQRDQGQLSADANITWRR